MPAEDDRPPVTDELPEDVVEVLTRPPGDAVAIVATVDDDGAPRTATFGAMRPVGPRELRFACNRAHATYDNITRDGRVMVATFAPPDVAVGIRGRARVVKERMDSLPEDAVVHLEVESVKNDHLPYTPIASGITYSMSAEIADRLDAVNEELETVGADRDGTGSGPPDV